MKEWYLIKPPSLSSGLENDSLDDYKSDAFAEIAATDAGRNVTLCNHDLSKKLETRVIMQNVTADANASSTKRQVLASVGLLSDYHYVKESNGAMWLLSGYPDNNGIYDKSSAELCEYRMYWQREDGAIISRYAWVQNASAYNNGEEGGNPITLQSNQFMVYVPYDDDTALLDNGGRINFCKNPNLCRPYKLTRPDDISYNWGKKGLLNIIFTQDQYDRDKDIQVELKNGEKVWICDYRKIENGNYGESLPVEPFNPEWNIVHKGNPSIVAGGNTKTFSACAIDDQSSILPVQWSVVTLPENEAFVSYSVQADGSMKVKAVYDKSIIGTKFYLSAKYQDSEQGKYITIGGGI